MDLSALTLAEYLLLFCAALLAGLIDAIAGGGGLITVPALLAVGLPPQVALGTNKLQASFGSGTAAVYFVRRGVVQTSAIRTGMVFTLVGAALGGWSVQQMTGELLAKAIPIMLLGIAGYSILTPRLGEASGKPKMPGTVFYPAAGLILGFYDGFFGPGVGSFWAFALVGVLGLDLMKATGVTKVMNFTSNIVSLLVFILGGKVLWSVGLVMAVGQITGARIGSSLAVGRGVTFIKPVFIGVVILTAMKLLVDQFFR